MSVVVLRGDASRLPLASASVDAVVCDPPYGLEFMHRSWDTFKPSAARIRTRVDQRTNPADGKSVTSTPEAYVAGQPFQAWCQAWAAECLRVLKPGGHLLAFGGTRTWHRLACGIEDAGFDIRDSIHWIYGSGFPKSLDVSKAIDKVKRRDYVLMAVELGMNVPGRNLDDWTKEGHSPGDKWWEEFKAHLAPEDWGRLERAVLSCAKGKGTRSAIGPVGIGAEDYDLTAPATEDAARWDGWGTALKPAHEPVIVARKPLAGTVAANVLEHGTGALNIDGCRMGSGGYDAPGDRGHEGNRTRAMDFGMTPGHSHDAGRWPPNILLTHSAACEMTGTRRVKGANTPGSSAPEGHRDAYGQIGGQDKSEMRGYQDADGMETVEAWSCANDCPVAELDRQSGARPTGGIVRAKRKSGADRDGNQSAAFGYESRPAGSFTEGYADTGGASRFFPAFRYQAKAPASERPRLEDGTAWPTVKPLELMRWLIRLVTPPGGLVLDPFSGTGTTGEAAALDGFGAILVDRDPQALALTCVRLSKAVQPAMFGLEA